MKFDSAGAAVTVCILLLSWHDSMWPRQSAEACQLTARSKGSLREDVVIETVTLTSSSGYSCSCCALCHQNAACASFSYQGNSGQCQLYSEVADYQTLVINPSWSYFVMPNRSQHHQFCREDSDCQAEGDFCRGRVCTHLTAVTCRVINEDFGVGSKFGVFPSMHGWLSGRHRVFNCRMYGASAGYTLLFRNRQGFTFSRDYITFYNDNPGGGTASSALSLADDIRLLRDFSTYTLLITTDDFDIWYWGVPRSEPVLTTQRADPVLGLLPIGATPQGSISGNTLDVGLQAVSLPYQLWEGEGEDLILVKVLVNGEQQVRALARTDGELWNGLLDNVGIFIRE